MQPYLGTRAISYQLFHPEFFTGALEYLKQNIKSYHIDGTWDSLCLPPPSHSSSANAGLSGNILISYTPIPHQKVKPPSCLQCNYCRHLSFPRLLFDFLIISLTGMAMNVNIVIDKQIEKHPYHRVLFSNIFQFPLERGFLEQT